MEGKLRVKPYHSTRRIFNVIHGKVGSDFPGETFRVLKEKEGYVQIQEESSGA